MKYLPVKNNFSMFTNSLKFLKVKRYISMFCCHFTKGNSFWDFLFAYLDEKVLQIGGLLFKKEICS